MHKKVGVFVSVNMIIIIIICQGSGEMNGPTP